MGSVLNAKEQVKGQNTEKRTHSQQVSHIVSYCAHDTMLGARSEALK